MQLFVWTSGCGGTFTAPQGILQSPSFPNTYPHNKQCEYLISQPQGQRIVLTFNNFTIEGGSCGYDYVEVQLVFSGRLDKVLVDVALFLVLENIVSTGRSVKIKRVLGLILAPF